MNVSLSVSHWLCPFLIVAFAIDASSTEPPVSKPKPTSWRWLERTTGFDASLRGLSAVNDQVLWACGSKATVIRTSDGGGQWVKCNPTGYDQLEFRSVVAVDELTATIASAGTPAVILQTVDGGHSWKETYRHPSPAAFFDGLKFWDRQRGIAFSDPVDGRLLIVTTNDGGAAWQPVAPEKIPAAREKEGGFAASNSVLCVGPKGRAWLGTGGTPSAESRIYWTNDYGANWSVVPCPLVSDAAAGIFSIAFREEDKLLIAVGGDYRPEAASKTTAALSRDFGLTWQLSIQPPDVFVSAVCFEDNLSQSQRQLIATGPTKSFCSSDGNYWEPFNAIGFHALSTSPTGKVFGVGASGRFGELRLID